MDNNTQPETTTTQKETTNTQTTTPVDVAKWAYERGIVPVEEVHAMQDFVDGKIDYTTMRSMCG